VSKPNETLKSYWRSLGRPGRTRLPLADVSEHDHAREFPAGADELEIPAGASRRKFMGILGASTALAGITGCVRKPVENILPFSKRPEDLIPGEPVYYATAFQVGATVQGLLVESQDGRPTKIEGNPQHSGSLGGTDIWAQASVLGLYDPDRSRTPRATTQAAHATAPDEKQAREWAVEVLCESVSARVLEESRSRDRAEKAAHECRERVASAGQWSVERTPEGVRASVAAAGAPQGESDWNTVWRSLDAVFADTAARKGEGVGLVVPQVLSPTFRGLLRELVTSSPQVRIYADDPVWPANAMAAAEAVGGPGTRIYYQLTDARAILAVDSDFLGHEQDHVRLTREYADGRKLESPRDPMNRLYVVGPNMTITAAQADNRLVIKACEVADFLEGLARELLDVHQLPSPGGADAMRDAIGKPDLPEPTRRFVAALAKDLADNKGKALVLVGERQPPAVHGVGLYINLMLRALGGGPAPSLMRMRTDVDAPATRALAELAADLDAGALDTVVCLGTNPVFDAPGGLALAEKLGKVKLLVHAGHYLDETGKIAHWHLPLSHYLEAWGDLEAIDGTTTIQQPLIAPLHETPSAIEVLARIARPGGPSDGLALVRGHWDREVGMGGVAERRWRRWLHDGLVTGLPRTPTRPRLEGWMELGGALKALRPVVDRTEVEIDLDPKILGGGWGNNGWLLELPDPITKLCWDNAALISPQMAVALGVKSGDMLDVKVGDATVSLPAWVSPGQHPDTVAVHVGWGRKGIGSVADGAGFDVYKLRPAEGHYFGPGAVARGAGTHELISTQDHGSLDPDDSPTMLGDTPGGALGTDFGERPLYRETDRQGYKQKPKFARDGDLMPPRRLKALWDRPELTGLQQWGMVIDLNSCTGCNVCTIACQAENNIPVVGKPMVVMGREMHWIRIDRYYRGDPENPQLVTQPIPCMQCESAPCETVCPVAATTHSPDGLNDMAYNRCIGTRYCSNNCPYKVRRYNYFNFNRGLELVEKMQKNPDVTVRTRGVMEKCTYCVQRINEAKIQAHTAGEDRVPDGVIATACEQACPARAITFGDKNDPRSRVAKLKKRDRNYVLLADLNTAPRTSYLARVRNPNPDLVPKPSQAASKEG
jgi:molybdopterin-containing oxidoreductase family iron-sulfur binding subunit